MGAVAVRIGWGEAALEANIASLAPACALQFPLKCHQARRRYGIVIGECTEQPDPPYPLGLLRARRERPSRSRAANNLHEITPSHCCPRSKTTPFGIQLPSSKQKIGSSETGLNAE